MMQLPGASTEEFLMVPTQDVEYLRDIADQNGVAVAESGSLGIEPVSTTAVALLGSSLAINTVRRLLEERRGGQMIDLRPGAGRAAYRSRDVQYGLIVVLTADGTVTVRATNSQDELALIIEALRGLVAGSTTDAGAVAQTVRERLGPDAEIVTGPAQDRGASGQDSHGND